MTKTVVEDVFVLPENASRKIVHRTIGRGHGAITRLVSPGGVGKLIKPFIFLDHFDAKPSPSGGFGWHPHSGLATLTLLLTGGMSYEDSTGQSGTLAAGSVEWMQAGAGVWHTGRPVGHTRVEGFQLWVALPASLEHASPVSQYIAPILVQQDGPVTVVLGRYGAAASVIDAPSPVTYLYVQLEADQSWRFDPSSGHTVGWVFIHKGRLHVSGEALENELAVFDRSDSSITVVAEGQTSFLLGSAAPHPYALHTGHYSVHTNADALRIGEEHIAQLGERLRSQSVF